MTNTTFHHGIEQVAIKFHFDGGTPIAYTRSYTGDLDGMASQYFCIPGHWPQDCFTQWVEQSAITNFLTEVTADPDWVQQ